MREIRNGFKILRKFKVIHRDIKLSNIFIDGQRIVIGDFGFAKTGKEMTGTTLGTPLTMAPEVIVGEHEYSSKTDLWSIGVVFYQLLCGEPPFFGLSHQELMRDIQEKSGENLKFDPSIAISAQS